MADQPTIYDLVLLLDSEAPEEQRQRVLSGVQSAIATAGGSVDRNDDWGRRPLSFEIRHRPEAEYHLLQFQAPEPSIEELSHTLRITDGVLRFRIIKVRPGTPEVRPGAPPVVAAVAGAGGSSSAPSSEGSAAPAASEAPPEEASAVEASEAPAAEASAKAPAEADQAGSEDAAEPVAEQASEETAGEDS